jgi:hypothetical protein
MLAVKYQMLAVKSHMLAVLVQQFSALWFCSSKFQYRRR